MSNLSPISMNSPLFDSPLDYDFDDNYVDLNQPVVDNFGMEEIPPIEAKSYRNTHKVFDLPELPELRRRAKNGDQDAINEIKAMMATGESYKYHKRKSLNPDKYAEFLKNKNDRYLNSERHKIKHPNYNVKPVPRSEQREKQRLYNIEYRKKKKQEALNKTRGISINGGKRKTKRRAK